VATALHASVRNNSHVCLKMSQRSCLAVTAANTAEVDCYNADSRCLTWRNPGLIWWVSVVNRV